MKRRLMVAVVVVLGCCVGTLPQSSRLVAQTAERDVYVTVLDADGTPITGLTADFFAVREGGRDRKVRQVSPLATPMHVAVLVDTCTGSAIPVDTYRDAISDFVGRLAALNQVALYSFGERAAPVVGFTQDPARLRAGLATMFTRSQGGSYLLDAIDQAVRDLQPIESRRPVIAAITTENVEASGRSAGSVVKQLIPRAIVFHAVVLASATGSDARTSGGSRISRDIPTRRQELESMIALGEGDRERTQMLRQGTSTTGGSLQRVTSLMALSPALTRLANECALGYRLTFDREGEKPLKDLQVGIMLENVTVRAAAAPPRK